MRTCYKAPLKLSMELAMCMDKGRLFHNLGLHTVNALYKIRIQTKGGERGRSEADKYSGRVSKRKWERSLYKIQAHTTVRWFSQQRHASHVRPFSPLLLLGTPGDNSRKENGIETLDVWRFRNELNPSEWIYERTLKNFLVVNKAKYKFKIHK